MNLPTSHFSLLRLAWLRGLEILPTAEGHNVSSYTHRHRWYHIKSDDSCPCPATEYCTHLALSNHARLRGDAAYREAWKEFAVADALKRYERERRPERRAAMKAADAAYPTTAQVFGPAVEALGVAEGA